MNFLAGTTVLKNSVSVRPSGVQLDAFAFIYPSDQHEGISRRLHGFEARAREKGRRLVMLPTGSDFKKEVEMIASLDEFDVRGAVACPVIATPQDQLRVSQLCLESRVPLVLVGLSLSGFHAAAVLLDNFEAGHAMTRHLLSLGVTKIGFLSNHSWAQFQQDRYFGYCRAMDEAGIEIRESWLHRARGIRPNFTDPVLEPTSIAKAFLETRPDVDAVVCADDFMALGLLQAASEMGYRVPDDLKITGIDDFAVSRDSSPSITTYRVPYEEMGAKAFDLLEAITLHNKDRGREILLRGEIVPRRSS